MNLWELIKWARETKRFGEYYDTNHRGVRIKQDALEFLSYNSSIWVDSDTFTVEIEEEITEETVLPYFITVGKSYDKRYSSNSWHNKTLNSIVNDKNLETDLAYLQNADGSIGDLIWTKEKGLVE